MKNRYLLWAIGVLLIVAGAILAHSQAMYREMRQGGWHGHRGMFMGMGMARNLNLTDAQKTQVKSLREQERPVIQPLLKQLAANHKELLAATANGSFDEAKVRAIASQQAQIMAQLMVGRQQMASKIYNTVLSADQKAKFDQMRETQTSRIDQWIQKGTTAKQ